MRIILSNVFIHPRFRAVQTFLKKEEGIIIKQEGTVEKVETLVEQVRTNIQDGKSDEEIFQSLQSFLGKDPRFDGHFAESLTILSDAKTAKILQRMLTIAKEKKVQKMIKRSLYRLKSKGIPVEGASPKKEASVLRPLKVELAKGFANGYDLQWNRFLILAIPRPGRGLTVLHGLISDTKGLVNFSGGEISRKEFRSFFKEVQNASPTPMVETEASYVGFLLHQAYQLVLRQGSVPPQDYLRLKGEIENVKREYERPLIYSYLPSDEVAGEDRRLGRGGDLLKLDLFSGWRIEEDLIRRYADEIQEAEESKIVLHPTQKEARLQGIYQKALSELFSGERRFLYKRRLEEMTYLLLKLGKEEEARLSLAVAVDLEKPLNLIQPNPFLFQLVVKSIFTLLAEAEEKRAKEPSLIIKP